ncbi:MAG: prepilin-type N-terminal cleavage/methylation domain-containing protein [Erysipelotrichaceae bacterium]|nr:prepilin-type N-terminal cleavage/methylation domain-containing protein [Erysipelotrichaceae bacterium]
MKKGFTLLEMIVVVSVITLLFLLSIPNIQKVLNLFEKKGCEAQLKVIDAAILEYKMEFNEIADDTSQLIDAGYITEEQTTCQNNDQIVIVDGQASIE